MSGYKTYKRMQDLDYNCASLGMTLTDGRTNGFPYGQQSAEQFFICVPDDDGTKLPVYTRGISLFNGDLEACEGFIRGWIKHQEYINALGFGKKIAIAEIKIADHYQGERVKRAIMEGTDPGYNNVLPDSKINAPF